MTAARRVHERVRRMDVPLALALLLTIAHPCSCSSARGASPQPAAMRWSDVSFALREKPILQGVGLEARAGRLLGVLGPSGAGKTTLLSILGGRLAPGRRKRNHLRAGSNDGVPGAQDVAMLEQRDTFFGLLTVRETLMLAATLERGDASRATCDEVDRLLQSLGLATVQHSRVGDATHRGISGGESRRLAVGCALLAEPALLVADEPTTGLDAHQAHRIIRLLRETALARGLPAVATLHQPRSSIWATLDDVLLLAPAGRVVFHGAREAALDYFAAVGHPCPPHTNPAEHLIDLVSVDHNSEAARALDEGRIDHLVTKWSERQAVAGCYCGVNEHAATAQKKKKSQDRSSPAAADAAPPAGVRPRRRRLGRVRRLGLLLRRSWRQNVRDTWANGLRLSISGGLALIFGEIFGRLGAPTAASLSERIALLSYASINMAMMSLMKTLDLLGRERPVVRHEAARGHYAPAEYVLSKLLAELPLDAAFAAGFGALLHWRVGLRLPPRVLVGTLALSAACSAGLGLAVGAMARTPESSLALGIPVMVVYMILGIINPAGTTGAKPPSLGVRLVSYASPIRWSVRALVTSELRGMELEQTSLKDAPRIGGLALVRSGDEVLDRLGLQDETSASCCVKLGRILAAELGVAAVALWLRAPRHA